MQACVFVKKAEYINDYVVHVELSDGIAGQVDLRELIYKYDCARPLRDTVAFAKFYLDEWPTLAWSCGFDIAPESLHALCLRQSRRAA